MNKKTRVRPYLLVLLAIDILFASWWFSQGQEGVVRERAVSQSTLAIVNMGVTQPLPLTNNLNTDKVALGRMLFEERRLSANFTIACSSCHILPAGGSDNRVHSIGINGGEGGVNAPSVFNSRFNFVQFWDGRAATLEDQIDGPLTHPKEMGSNWKQVLLKLNQDETYREQFAKLYPDEITVANVKDAIATFERSLVTVNSRFDQYLRGNASALNDAEKKGYELFQSYGCISCHQGMNLGGNMYERMGLLADYFGDRGNLTEADYGRFNVTKKESDRYYFRVPSLRNVSRTAPYFHDGSAATLEDAVKVMAKYQLGRSMPDEDRKDIVAFLMSLDGVLSGAGQ